MSTVALTIAGSDPSGGAGIQADLKTFHQFGVYGEAVITLLTVQNTRHVMRVEVMEADLVRQQIEAVVSDIPPAAVKTGALGNVQVVSMVAQWVAQWAQPGNVPLIVDPVMISKHGAPLLSPEAQEILKHQLIPHALLVTPNLPEAEALTGKKDPKKAAEQLLKLGCRAVLIKGGHAAGEPTDLFYDADGSFRLPGRRIETKHTHGTGCTLSAAITALVAGKVPLRAAVEKAKLFVQNAIETAPQLGHGQGPVNHWAEIGKGAV